MCGICGIYHYRKSEYVSPDILARMNRQIAHRGPDGEGVYTDRFIGLAHRRLSVIDPTNGQQPMSNERKSVWITYNGEIYNYLKLKEDLEQRGHHFRTNCDTEVIVHAYEEYGENCISFLNGMFAFALWDQDKEILLLVRDRLGIKPLYYAKTSAGFIFGSEIKAILAHPSMRKETETDSVLEYLFCTAILNGNTMFKNVFSLPAGHFIVFKDQEDRLEQYWDIKSCLVEDRTSFRECKDKAYDLLDNSVRMRMMSDVPFGALLSGGLDSSFTSALASRYNSSRLKTFSMEYENNVHVSSANSDTTYAKIIADSFQTDHKEYIFASEKYDESFDKTIWHVEKPIELTSPSLFLLYEQLRKDNVTVVLSGEGADELFGGYFFFLKAAQNGKIKEFPWAPFFEDVYQIIKPEIRRETDFENRMKVHLHEQLGRFQSDDYINKALYLFLKVYLLEMLERQDKTSMAWGIESRVPFLDHHLVNFVANIPSSHKIKGDTEKLILKEMARNILPRAVVERKKKPFPFPVDPKSLIRQRKIATELVTSGSSQIARYFDKKATHDFFNRQNQFNKIDNLAIFRTSFAMIALEKWHRVFGV